MAPASHDNWPIDDQGRAPAGRTPPTPDSPPHPRRPGGAARPAGRHDPGGPVGPADTRRNGAARARTGRRSSRRTARRALRRESPSVIAVLANEADFAAMRDYATFPFANHARYLRQVDGWLKARALRDQHTTVALFHPAVYRAFCAEAQLDPDSPTSRAHYAAEAAATGPALPHAGQPLSSLIPELLAAEEHRSTLARALGVLAELGACAECGEDIASAALARAGQAIHALLHAAGPGLHHLVCSVPTEDGSLIAALHVRAKAGDAFAGPVTQDERETFRTVLAIGLAGSRPGGVVLRTMGADHRDTVRGWTLRDHWLFPLTEAQVFSAYCTDPDTGEPLAPEPGVDYRAGLVLPRPEDERP